MPPSFVRLAAAVTCAALCLASSASGAADGGPPPADAQQTENAVWIIEAGREDDVTGLLAPHYGATPDAWSIESIRIGHSRVDIDVRAGSDTGTVTFRHPSFWGPTARRTESFVIFVDASGEAVVAAEALADAIDANDDGTFWRSTALIGNHATRDRATHVLTHRAWMVGLIVFVLALGSRRLLGSRAPPVWACGLLAVAVTIAVGWGGPTGDRFRAVLSYVWRLKNDGVVRVVVLMSVLGFLSWRRLRRSPRWVTISLAAITVIGVVVRLALSPRTVLGAWPYTRHPPNIRDVWYGDVIHVFVGDGMPYLTDMTAWHCFVFAAAAPIAVYCHGSQLLKGDREGIIAAAFIALLPMHIRFSISEVAFIPSIVMSSLSFALLHSALKEESRGWRLTTAVLLFPTSYLAFTARPLNILFAGLLVFTAVALVPPSISWRRRLPVALSLCVSAGLALYFYLFAGFAAQVHGSSDPLMILQQTFRAFFSFRFNTLARPDLTPVVLLPLVVVGGVAGWRTGRRLVVLFLVAWYGGFLATHSVILPEAIEMNARYHLHLVVPFILLAALGASAFWDQPRRAAGVGVALAASWLLCVPFIRTQAFGELQEFNFVRAHRESLPEGCVVIEHVHPVGVPELRFLRVGEYLGDGRPAFRYTSVVASTDEQGVHLDDAVAAALAQPEQCVAFYLGLPCYYAKAESTPIAPVCEEILSLGDWELIDETRVVRRNYNLVLHDVVPPPRDSLRVALYRLRTPPHVEGDAVEAAAEGANGVERQGDGAEAVGLEGSGQGGLPRVDEDGLRVE